MISRHFLEHFLKFLNFLKIVGNSLHNYHFFWFFFFVVLERQLMRIISAGICSDRNHQQQTREVLPPASPVWILHIWRNQVLNVNWNFSICLLSCINWEAMLSVIDDAYYHILSQKNVRIYASILCDQGFRLYSIKHDFPTMWFQVWYLHEPLTSCDDLKIDLRIETGRRLFFLLWKSCFSL